MSLTADNLIYYWKGKNVGYTGYGSGWSGATNTWTSVLTGTVHATHDPEFSPYYWGNVNNWYVDTTPGPIQSPGRFKQALRLPKGGDTVRFTKKPTDVVAYANSGFPNSDHWTSCLYSGMTGEPFSYTSARQWLTTPGYSTGSTGTIAIYALMDTFNINTVPGTTFSYNNLGIPGYTGALRVLTTSCIIDTTTGTSNYLIPGGTCSINNLLSSSTGLVQNTIFVLKATGSITNELDPVNHPKSKAYIYGNWSIIDQQANSIFAEHVTPPQNLTETSSWQIGKWSKEFYSSDTVSIRKWNIDLQGFEANPAIEPLNFTPVRKGYIWGSTGGVATINYVYHSSSVKDSINYWAESQDRQRKIPYFEFTIGGFNSTSSPQFILNANNKLLYAIDASATYSSTTDEIKTVEGAIEIGALAGVGIAERCPIFLGNCTINNMNISNVALRISPSVTELDSVYIEHGTLSGYSKLYCAHPVNPIWKNLYLGLTGAGLLINNDNVCIYPLGGIELYTDSTFIPNRNKPTVSTVLTIPNKASAL